MIRCTSSMEPPPSYYGFASLEDQTVAEFNAALEAADLCDGDLVDFCGWSVADLVEAKGRHAARIQVENCIAAQKAA